MESGRKLGIWMWIRLVCWLVRGRTFPLVLIGALALTIFGATALNGTSDSHDPANSRAVATAASGARSFAGHWMFQFFAFCAESDVALCDQMKTGVPGAYTQVATILADSDAKGRFTFQSERMITDNSKTISPQCNARFFAGTPISGVCRMTGHGTGYFAPANGTILPVLWITDEWVTFYGQSGPQVVHNPVRAPAIEANGFYPYSGWNGPYPQALPIPAVPGHYDDTALGQVIGGSPPTDFDEVDQVQVTRY